ncbi:hypothetical protein NG895_00460 [Aeoliella sp. ICT_H6.2]|uniref:Uncharacterized protein n=1 Tax=Aeoliella straminimaris TaxID=2954799 RepID=A0A9X2FAE6_9BACT|nr:hypothetical protein [Aeoliella straminimaris]MCO6042366.1 hypothetical protein [Aeoliella straminimaris]
MSAATTTNEMDRSTKVSTQQQNQLTDESMQPVPDLIDYVRDYARQKPKVAAMWCFGLGFVLGWRLKPW